MNEQVPELVRLENEFAAQSNRLLEHVGKLRDKLSPICIEENRVVSALEADDGRVYYTEYGTAMNFSLNTVLQAINILEGLIYRAQI